MTEEFGNGQGPVAAPMAESEMMIPDLLDQTMQKGASDLHLTAGSPPVIRYLGDLVRLSDYPVLTPQGLRTMIYSIISQKQREKLEQELELDLSYSLPGKARFRVNVYFQRDSIGAAFRMIPFEVKPLQGHPRPLEFLVDPGHVGQRPRHAHDVTDALEQPGFELGIVPLGRQRPRQSRLPGSAAVLGHRPQPHAAGPGDGPVG